MQRQDQRMQAGFAAGARRISGWIAVATGIVGLLLIGLGALAEAWGGIHPAMFIAFAVIFAFAIVRGLRNARSASDARTHHSRFAEGSIARIARRMVRRLHATLEIDYELAGTRLRSKIATPRVDHVVDLAKITVAIVTPHSIVLFRRRFSQYPKRIVYADREAEREAVLAVLKQT